VRNNKSLGNIERSDSEQTSNVLTNASALQLGEPNG
jgi:hypothetical protein